MIAFSPVTHVLFDMDGLLLDTSRLYTTAFQNIVSKFGKNYDWETKVKLMGLQMHEAADFIISRLDLPMSRDELIEESNKQFAVLLPDNQLLPDTEELYTVAFQNIVSKFGKNYTYELKVSLMGSQAHETADRIIKALDLPLSRDEFVDISKKEFADLFPTTEVLPGARRLIEHLHKHNIPIGLATSSSVESYELKTNHHQQLFSLFPFKTFGSDSEVRQGKPSPDIFFVAAGRFPDKPDPSKCLVFEDSVNGVKAAKAAGMQVVMVPDSRLDKSYTKEATLVLNSLEDFKPEVFSLPPYDD
ncbi:pseudouridine-5'-phosphatase-like isoform X2 [Choristoneura fumiferana]|uniref:pseudouridine-5'-phosphatase-like isoform X2 n=1 Tax=Choristoneura fumiferana TaxID=7141 RepID=UPI003D154A80